MAGSSDAAPVAVGPVVIAVPDGFAVAQTEQRKKTLVTAWTKSARNGSLKTLLQVNVIDFGSAPGKPAAAPDLPVYAEKYLRQFLSGIERRRTDYVSSPFAHIKLAGLPAVRATWNGAVGGRATVGVIYSVIVKGKYAVILQTQDLGSLPSSGMLEAMQAIESTTLTRPAAPGALPSVAPAPTGPTAPASTGPTAPALRAWAAVLAAAPAHAATAVPAAHLPA